MKMLMARRFQSLASRYALDPTASAALARSFHRSSVAAFPEIPFKLADIGEGIAEVEVLQWFVKEGDAVKQFQNVCEVQSDKATVEITSRYDGVVKKVHYKLGEMAKVGSTLIDIDVDEATAATFEASTASSNKSSSVSPVPRRAAPTPVVAKKQVPPAAIATPVVEVAPVAPLREAAVRQQRGSDDRVLTSPSVRRLAKEHEIDLLDVVGTGPDGRLLKEDLLEHIRMLASQPKVDASAASTASTAAAVASSATGSSASYLEQDVVVALSPMQKMMVKSMNAALQVPHFGYADEIQMDALYQLRNDLKPLAEQRGTKLSFMPFIIKAASLALKRYPSLNATVSADETSVTYVAAHNISVAMDTPTGLIVPNVKDVQHKSILEIAEELNRLQALATAGKLTPADLTGGTFSISNIGSIGGTYMSPVILLPQVAIGAIGKIQTLPRFLEDGVSVTPVRVMNVSWSGDHRVIDGATMARFSNQWKQYLETPLAMLSEMN